MAIKLHVKGSSGFYLSNYETLYSQFLKESVCPLGESVAWMSLRGHIKRYLRVNARPLEEVSGMAYFLLGLPCQKEAVSNFAEIIPVGIS